MVSVFIVSSVLLLVCVVYSLLWFYRFRGLASRSSTVLLPARNFDPSVGDLLDFATAVSRCSRSLPAASSAVRFCLTQPSGRNELMFVLEASGSDLRKLLPLVPSGVYVREISRYKSAG